MGMTSSMMIRKTRRDDSALFQCLATNKFGNSQKTIKLVVQVRYNCTLFLTIIVPIFGLLILIILNFLQIHAIIF